MKQCLVCMQMEEKDDAPTCASCGEGSWSEPKSGRPDSSQPPSSGEARKGKRRGRVAAP